MCVGGQEVGPQRSAGAPLPSDVEVASPPQTPGARREQESEGQGSLQQTWFPSLRARAGAVAKAWPVQSPGVGAGRAPGRAWPGLGAQRWPVAGVAGVLAAGSWRQGSWGGGLGPLRLLLQVGETYRPCWAPGADPAPPPAPKPPPPRGPRETSPGAPGGPSPSISTCVVIQTPLPLLSQDVGPP